MIDYHVHLWPHPEVAEDADVTVERLADYCALAASRGVNEIALTEHFFRFRRGREVVDGFWADERNEELRSYIAGYFDHHATADLDHYVEVVGRAKAAGLPVRAGLEVDYYPGRMDEVAALLAGYPFDVLLGSVHWLGTWMFDVLGAEVQSSGWDRLGVETAWRGYAAAIEELAASGATDVLAHPDLIKIAGRFPDPAVLAEVEGRIAEAARSSGMAAEISSAGLHKPVGEVYPSPSLLSRFAAAAVPVTTASDTHGVARVADEAARLHALASGAGYTTLRAFAARSPRDVPLGATPPDPPPDATPDATPDPALRPTGPVGP